ncbi:MAG: isochorismatase family protein [Candidatus Neomarinimicrobiota bacterium]
MLQREQTVLVIVDVQKKLADLMYKKNALYHNLVLLIKGAKLLGLPIIWMEQVPEKLGPTIIEVRNLLKDQNPIKKSAFSCAENEEFLERIELLNPHAVILCGIETHVCIYQTAADLLKRDFHVEVVADAVSSRTEFNMQMGLDRIMLDGGLQTSVEMVLFELQGRAVGDEFRALIKLIK